MVALGNLTHNLPRCVYLCLLAPKVYQRSPGNVYIWPGRIRRVDPVPPLTGRTSAWGPEGRHKHGLWLNIHWLLISGFIISLCALPGEHLLRRNGKAPNYLLAVPLSCVTDTQHTFINNASIKKSMQHKVRNNPPKKSFLYNYKWLCPFLL